MGLQINNSEKQPLEFSMSDDATKRVSKKIVKLAMGLTPKQFCEAIEFALSELNQSTILSIQSGQPIN